jgi:phospholipid/cholesterol/gamma-HCH transport system substrate-binding protein
METRARYTLVGVFVLVCLVSGFAFVYWIANTGGMATRAVYAVRFDEPISGVTPGASVLFNGVRVGAVSAINLDPRHPKRVSLLLSINPSTPVRADTEVSLNFQGLTGAPAVLLKGSSPDAPPLTSQNGEPPLLVAAAGAGESLTEQARVTLKRVDDVVAQNAKPLNTAITGMASFAELLGHNSARLEGLLGGLENLAGTGKKDTILTYDLNAADNFPGLQGTISSQLAIGDVNASLVFDTQKIQRRTADGAYAALSGVQWADTLPKLVQAKLVQSFENAHQLGSVSRSIEQLTPEYRLDVSIRAFQLGAEGKANVELAARIINEKSGNVKAAKIFSAAFDEQSNNIADRVLALSAAFAEVERELVLWTVNEV